MHDLYDRLENRVPQTRESILFRDLRHILAIAKSRVPVLRAQLKGVDLAALTTRGALSELPIIRKREIGALQAEQPPLGGLCATRPAALRQILVGSDGHAVPEGQAKDWWGAARALYAAGLRKGDIVLNCFTHETGLNGHIIASGANALGCPIIPLSVAPLDFQVEATTRLKPRFYCGRGDHLKRILDRGVEKDADLSSIRHGLVMGPLSPGLRNELTLRGIAIKLAFAMPELGLVAFESGSTEGLTLNENLILEFVEPGGRALVAPGEPGEMVITRLNSDFPLLRFGTGAISALMSSPSTCGRTNMRIRAPIEHAADCAEFDGLRIHSGQVVEIARHHPSLGRLRLVVRRAKEQDVLILRAEHRGDEASLGERLSETLHKVTRKRGTVEFVMPGSLRDDESVIIDERPLN